MEGPQLKLPNMQAQLERRNLSVLIKKELGDTFSLTSSSTSFENDDDTSFASPTSLASVPSKRLSTLQELNIQNVDTTKQLMSRIAEVESQLQSKSEAMQAELNQWKEKHSLAEKALPRAISHYAKAIKDPPSQYSCFTTNNELIEECGDDTPALASSSASIYASTANLDMSRGQIPSRVIVEGPQLKLSNMQAQFENDNDTFTSSNSPKYGFYGGTKELDRSSVTSIAILLCTAAKNLQITDCDISHFERKLKEDWFNEVEHLKNRSVEFLARYMPWRLAEEVHKVVDSTLGCSAVISFD